MSNEQKISLEAFVYAGWQAIAIGACIALVQYILYMALMWSQPPWLIGMMGPNVTWKDLQQLWLLMMVGIKWIFWVFLLSNVWLALYVRRIRRGA